MVMNSEEKGCVEDLQGYFESISNLRAEDFERWKMRWGWQVERARNRSLASDWNRELSVFLVSWTGTRFRGYGAFVEQLKIRMGWRLRRVEGSFKRGRDGAACVSVVVQLFSVEGKHFLPATWMLREDELDRTSVDGATVEQRTWNDWQAQLAEDKAAVCNTFDPSFLASIEREEWTPPWERAAVEPYLCSQL
ncbi:hypothetical protein BGZ60DRAFT_526389 [Tricladium varicosporioides]|nr:hypothetical protein BGZ60DRAFT_526389 [Hymenoscyphus varicosporioides]